MADIDRSRVAEYERLGITPTEHDGSPPGIQVPWDEEARPRREPSGADVRYTEAGRQTGRHLIDVHDMLRHELEQLRSVLAQVRDGAISAGEARSALNAMAMRQNDWTLGSFCARYCFAVASHHGLEDGSVFPHLVRSEPSLGPVIERLGDEHLVIHDAIEGVDAALVEHINEPRDYSGLERAIDLLSAVLLSHLSYEEDELVEPLARLGFYPDQV